VISDEAHELSSADPFKGNIDITKVESAFSEHGDKVACIYVELCVNSCGGHPVSLENLKAIRTVATAHRVPLFLDACRILENSYLIKQREPHHQNRSIREIVLEICSCADGLTMSALKDFLVPTGGFVATRDEPTYQKTSVQNFLSGDQPSSTAMEMITAAMQEVFANDSYVASRVEQVHYLWRRLKDGVPLVSPSGGHAVFIDAKSFLPHVAAENFPADALAAFIYHVSGIRVTKGPPLAASQTARGVELLRLAVPARRYMAAHLDDVTEAIQYAHANRNEIKGLKKIDKPGRSRFEPPLFSLL